MLIYSVLWCQCGWGAGAGAGVGVDVGVAGVEDWVQWMGL